MDDLSNTISDTINESRKHTRDAINHIFCHYDYEFLQTLDITEYEDLFVQDAINYPIKHRALSIDKNKINFNEIKNYINTLS